MATPDNPSSLDAVAEDSGPIGKGLLKALSTAADISVPTLHAYVRLLRRRHPDATPAEIQKKINDHFTALAMASGAGVGATAMVPGIGTMMALGATAAESFLFLDVAAMYALSSAALRGHDITEREQRNTVVLMTMAGSSGTVLLNDALVGASGTKLATSGPKLLAQTLAAPGLKDINSQLSKRVVKHLTKRTAAAGLGKLAPAGIGAVLGGWANRKLANQVVEAISQNLGDTPAEFPENLALTAPDDAQSVDAAQRILAAAEAAKDKLAEVGDGAWESLGKGVDSAKDGVTAAADFARDGALAAGGFAVKTVKNLFGKDSTAGSANAAADEVIDGEVVAVEDVQN